MSFRRACWYTSEVRDDKSLTIDVSDVMVCCVNILVVILSVTANGFVVYRYLKTRFRQPVSNTLLFILASFDLLHSIVSQPVFIASVVFKLHDVFACPLHNASKILFILSGGIAFTMTAVVLTSERLLAIVYPIWHRVHLRKSHVIGFSLAVSVIWTSVMLVFLLAVYNRVYFRMVMAGSIGICLVYALGGYIKIYTICQRCKKRQRNLGKFKQKTVVCGTILAKPGVESAFDKIEEDLSLGNDVKQSAQSARAEFKVENNNNQRMKSNTDVNQRQESVSSEINTDTKNTSGNSTRGNSTLRNPSQSHRNQQEVTVSRRERKTIIRMLCILGAMFVCNLPALLMFIYTSNYGVDYVTVSYFAPWTRTVVFLNTIINPVLYCYRNEHFHSRKLPRTCQSSSGTSNRAFSSSSDH